MHTYAARSRNRVVPTGRCEVGPIRIEPLEQEPLTVGSVNNDERGSVQDSPAVLALNRTSPSNETVGMPASIKNEASPGVTNDGTR